MWSLQLVAEVEAGVQAVRLDRHALLGPPVGRTAPTGRVRHHWALEFLERTPGKTPQAALVHKFPKLIILGRCKG